MSIYLTPHLADVSAYQLRKQKDFYYSKDGFEAKLDLSDFKPDEIKVKTIGHSISVEAEHDERSDSFSTITRCFKRKFFLPENLDSATVTSKVTSDGILILSAAPHPEKPENIVTIHKS